MSLVSDALRKAQVETAQSDRLQHRFYMTHGGRAGVAPPRVPRMAILVSAILGGCITAGALLFYLGSLLPTSADAVRSVPAPASVAAPAAQAIDEKPVAAAAPAIAEKPVDDVPSVVREKPKAERAKRVADEERRVEPPVVTPAETPAPSRRTRRDSFVAGETYVSPIRGPMGIEIALSGISSARGDSVAIINGTLMRRGSVVGPFVIEEIESRRVRVRYVDVSFWLTY